MKQIIFASLLMAPAIALADCPKNPDISQALDAAYNDLQGAAFPADAQVITQRLWELWFTAPDQKAQTLLDQGTGLLRAGNLGAAQTVLGELIAYCPDYAEGYNQRAFARYLSGDFEGALPDLARALFLRPRHLGAISGKGLTLQALGREDQAMEELRKALRLNPWTPERQMIEDLETDI